MLNPLIVANWKCNPVTSKEARHLFEVVRKGLRGCLASCQASVKDAPQDAGQPQKGIEVVICPPFIYISNLKSQISNLKLGGQDCFWQEQGAATGEISPFMLKDLGCQYVIIGHSERRRYFNETDEMINKKIKAALKARLKPILCVGETLEPEQEEGLNVLRRQIITAFNDVSSFKFQVSRPVIAYEPVWAIGTGQPCLPDEAMKTALFIRKILTKLYSRKIAEQVRILYGGSVTSKNAADYIKGAGMDGLLVGGASLNGTDFVNIVKNITQIRD